MPDDFTYESYRALLGRLASSRENLRFCDVRDAALPERFFLLRHDVDFCPRRALAMARVEAEAGYRASYFFLLTSDVYNLFSPDMLSVPREMVALGHEVGLHYDVAALEAWAPGAVGELLHKQAAMLSDLGGAEVVSIAMHNPSTSGADPFRNGGHGDVGKKFVNVYDDAFTREIAYGSDSCGAWRDDTYRLLAGDDAPPRIQLLIHPLFWEATDGDRWSRLTAWEAQKDQALAAAAEVARDIWRHHEGVKEHDIRTSGAPEKDAHGTKSG